MNRILYKYF